MSFVRICAIALVGLLLVPELAPGQPTRIPPFTGANYINDVILYLEAKCTLFSELSKLIYCMLIFSGKLIERTE